MSERPGDPVRLIEDAETGDRFLVFATDKGMRLDIRYSGDTLWMTQSQIASLFGRDQSVISKHISSILDDGELDAERNMQKMHTARSDRPISLYNLDMVISVGYRVSSKQGTLFRRWATSTLVQFAKKGFVVDSIRLKQPDNAGRIAELREIIRDIRSDEANVYRELKNICAICQDYDASSDTAHEFYQRTQAKLVHAVTSQTPAEIVAARANHQTENMRLTTWPNDNIRKTDVVVSKNYLAETEIREFNRPTTILLDIFEDQLDIGHLVVMADARELLDRQLKQLGRGVLASGGRISADDAKLRPKPNMTGSMNNVAPSVGEKPIAPSRYLRIRRKVCLRRRANSPCCKIQ